MKTRSKNKTDLAWLDAITELGCIVCWLERTIFSPAAPHHIDGTTKVGCHLLTIPLCGCCHQTGPYGVAFHATGRKTWEANHGTERELLELTRSAILQVKPDSVPDISHLLR